MEDENRVEPLATQSLLFEQVLDRLRASILNKRLQPGEKLKTSDLAVELGVSRMPVREALHRLELEGLVERRPHHGLVVASLAADEVCYAFELAGVIEAMATGKAAEIITADGIQRLEAILSDMDAPIERRDYAAYHAGNRRFHGEICAWYPSRRAQEMIVSLYNYIYRLRAIYPPSLERLQEARAEHLAILDALRRRDAVLAEQIAREHNRHSVSELTSQLRLTHDGAVTPR